MATVWVCGCVCTRVCACVRPGIPKPLREAALVAFSSWICPGTCACEVIRSLLVTLIALRPHGPQPIRLFCPGDSPGKNPGVGCHFLLQASNVRLLHLLHWQAGSLSLVQTHPCGQLHASLRQEVGGTRHTAVPQFL